MRLALFGRSALAVWLTTYAMPVATGPSSQEILANEPRLEVALPYLQERFPQIPRPYQLSAATWKRGAKDGIEVMTTQRELPSKSFCHVDHGVFVPVPELCLIQLATSCTLPELILIGSALCGTFLIDPNQRSGLGERAPITSQSRIAHYLEKCTGHRGVQICRRALPYIADGAASPPEVFLRMVLTLPGRLGGFGLSRSEANKKLKLSKRAAAIAERNFVVPDLCWPKSRVAVEYDSNAEHLSPQQATRDAKKRLALEADGFSVVTITTSQLAKAESMGKVASELSRRTERRHKTRSSRFPSRQSELFALQWKLNGYVDHQWIKATQRTAAL